MVCYNVEVKFKDWIVKKYVEWRGDAIGNDRSITEFAAYIGVSQPVMSGWMNGSVPNRKGTIDKLVAKFPEVYEILGLPGPVVSPPEWLSLLPSDLRNSFEKASLETKSRLSEADIVIDSPEGREIMKKTFSEFGITLNEIE